MSISVPRRFLQTAVAGGALVATVAVGAGPVSAAGNPAALVIDGGRTSLTLNAAVSSTLLNAGVTVTPSGPASVSILTRSGGPAIRTSYPVTSGTVAANGRVRINHAGDEEFTSPSAGTFVVSSPRVIINPDGSGTFTVRVKGQGRVQAATLDFSNAVVVFVDAHLRVAKVTFALSAGSADVFNLLAGADVFSAGQIAGTANVRVHLAP